MVKKALVLLVVFCMVSSFSSAYASDDSELILKVLIKKGIITQAEVDEMRKEIAAEKAKAGVVAEAPKSVEERLASVEKDLLAKVGLDKLSSKLKIKGRWAAGYFDSEKTGSFSSGSFQAPEAKIQFTFKPDDINDIIMRLNLNNAAFNNVDYFYLDTNLMKLTPWEKISPFTLASRLGRFKIDFGEETFSNNPVESILPSNSAANVAGNDEGLMLTSKIGKANPLILSFGVYNGNTGTGADNNWLKAFAGKLSYNLIPELYVSGSYYHSGELDSVNSEMSIAGLNSPASGAGKWNRQMFEVDARYDIKKGKVLSPPAYCDSLGFIRGALGHFVDTSSNPIGGGRAEADREGSYGYIEAFWNLTSKFYVASRASYVGLNGVDNMASLNSITANRYERYSFGVGYRMTQATLLKGEYSVNRANKTGGTKEPHDDLLSLVISSQF